MKIAVFHDLASGGAQRFLYEYAKLLKERGHQLFFFCFETSERAFMPFEKITDDIVIYPLKFRQAKFRWTRPWATLRNLFVYLNASRLLAGQINQGGYDFVFVHPSRYIHNSPILKYLKGKTVFFCQEIGREFYERYHFDKLEKPEVKFWSSSSKMLRFFKKWIDARAIHFASLVLTNSHFSQEAIFWIYGVWSEVCYPGIDVHFFEYHQAKRENFVLSVGRLVAHKRHDFIVHALALIPEQKRPRLVIVGDDKSPEYQEHLEELCQNLRVDLEIHLGIQDQELKRFYQHALCLCFAAQYEPFGLAVVEAMACGTPVVAVAEGGVRETILEGQTGFLTSRDSKSFSEAVLKLMDDSLSQEMGEKAARWVRDRWDLKTAVQFFEKRMKKMIQEGKTSLSE